MLMAIVIGGAAGCAGTVAAAGSHPARKMGRSRNTKKKKKTRKIHPV